MKKMLMMLAVALAALGAFAQGLYCVIDLSGGTSAASYPIAYLDAVPSGGWTDEYKTTKLVLRHIEPGAFTMGSPTDEVGLRGEDEVQHAVTLSTNFWMGVFEVTQKQYELVTGLMPSLYVGANRPVERITYLNASAFAWQVGEKTGLAACLPTEAQWEYACRAGTTTALNNGKNLSSPFRKDDAMDEVGRYVDNRDDGSGGYTDHTVVGSYAPNAWGLYDMHGNVHEWCRDWYGAYSGDATDPTGPATGTKRVQRGGDYYYFATMCRSAARKSQFPSTGGGLDGLRLCIGGTVEPPPKPVAIKAKPTPVNHTTNAVYTNGFLSVELSPGSWSAWSNGIATVQYTAEKDYCFEGGETVTTVALNTSVDPAVNRRVPPEPTKKPEPKPHVPGVVVLAQTNIAAAATSSASYRNVTMTTGDGYVFTGHAAIAVVSGDVSRHYCQLNTYGKKQTYVKIPEMPGAITNITLTVTGCGSQKMGEGGNTATYSFCAENGGAAIASANGDKSVSIDLMDNARVTGYINVSAGTRFWELTVYSKVPTPASAGMMLFFR